jgi:hypothetical protein
MPSFEIEVLLEKAKNLPLIWPHPASSAKAMALEVLLVSKESIERGPVK